ncbi:hypothetical protein BROUX41_003309 [Berkeleyomyces rouxiae]
MSRLFTPIRALLRSPPALSRPSSSLRPSPGPPRLPAAEQAEFERLQRLAASALTNPNSNAATAALADAPGGAGPASLAPSTTNTSTETVAAAAAAAEAQTPEDGALFRGAKPEFNGDTNPATGEVGGPKNEPLRWGGQSDWSFNGRATDF